jgi:hypothetical protein
MAKPPAYKLTEKEILDIINTEQRTDDRPAAYLALWQLTRSTEALEQARISSFSGTVGGIASAANMFDKKTLGSKQPFAHQ